MISLDVKSEAKTTSSSPLSLQSQTSGDEPTLSFSQLLKGVSEKKDDKVIQNGSLILSLGADEKDTKDVKGISKLDTLMSLLKSDEVLEKEEPIELHPKLTQNLSTKEIKTLVADAKSYLKDKIQASDDYKLSQVKELPKTLKGLATMAKKLNIDISKITVEEVQTKSPTDKLAKIEPMPLREISKDKEVKEKSSPIKDILQAKEIPKEKELKVQKSQVKDTGQIKEVPKEMEVKTQALHVKDVPKETEVKTKITSIKEVATEKEVPKETEVKTQALHVKEVPKEKELKVRPLKEVSKETEVKIEFRDEKLLQSQKEIKATPLFKAQASVEHTSTEQIVQSKVSTTIKVEHKTSKDKADETLKLLLRGEKPSINNTLTADFAVATARVVAPSATTEVSKSIEQLLHGDTQSSESTSSKLDGLTTHKSDSFEVKLNEAKQMIKYISADVKTAIEDYKSPFTRIKVQLNPQKLGEVDLTVIQRGKNLHVTLSSNNAAINTLALNANDLKAQLSNNGINNASLNFNNSSQDNQNAQQEQQNRQNERQAREEYNYLDKEEANEEVLNLLEIIVPQYV